MNSRRMAGGDEDEQPQQSQPTKAQQQRTEDSQQQRQEANIITLNIYQDATDVSRNSPRPPCHSTPRCRNRTTNQIRTIREPETMLGKGTVCALRWEDKKAHR